MCGVRRISPGFNRNVTTPFSISKNSRFVRSSTSPGSNRATTSLSMTNPSRVPKYATVSLETSSTAEFAFKEATIRSNTPNTEFIVLGLLFPSVATRDVSRVPWRAEFRSCQTRLSSRIS